MKTLKSTILAILCVLAFGTTATAQEFSIGADLVSTYVFRGLKYDGPSIQPGISYTTGGLEVGAWGSFSTTGITNESDLYISYGFDGGFSIGIADYFYQGDGDTPHNYISEYFDYSKEGAHAFELNLGYEVNSLAFSANYIFNESAGAGSAGGDMYFEAAYAFETFDVFVGAGDGWHTADTDFALCNIGLGTSKEIEITEKFSLPVFAQVTWNPSFEQYNIVIGISL